MDAEQAATLWETWKKTLVQGKIPNAEPTEFIESMCWSTPSIEAAELAKKNIRFCDALQRTMKPMVSPMFERIDDDDLQRVMIAIFDNDSFETFLLDERENYSNSMEDRVSFVGTISNHLCSHAGRQWVRDRAVRWWRNAGFSEEEGDELVENLLIHEVFRVEDFEQWGPTAAESARRVTQRAIRNGNLRWSPNDVASVQQIGSPSTPLWLRERTGLLSQTLSILADLKDSGFQKSELDRLQKRVRPSIGDWPLLERAIERRMGKPLRHMFREFPELAAALLVNPQVAANPAPSPTAMQLPLLRLMHMRMLLESPSLSDSLQAPELFFIPDVVQYVLGRDYVSYAPELRVFESSERRWRARWVETTAEAMASLVLEDALRFDLTTLSRIPEGKEPTPDFMGVTDTDEKIVFETKGATAWKTHRSQRKEALVQLGKSKPSKSSGGGQHSWAGHGHSFAISLFAAKQGDDRASLLHVNDPVFAFDRLFDQSWEDRSRRLHFAAVLEAAQLFDVAEALTHREPIQSDNMGRTEQTRFRLDDTNTNEDGQQFVGSYLPIEDWARRIRHPDRDALKKLSVFVGVEGQRFENLASGRLPARCRSVEHTSDSKLERTQSLPSRTGLLPSREYPGQSRGVFSLLSNGSILAIEVGP